MKRFALIDNVGSRPVQWLVRNPPCHSPGPNISCLYISRPELLSPYSSRIASLDGVITDDRMRSRLTEKMPYPGLYNSPIPFGINLSDAAFVGFPFVVAFVIYLKTAVSASKRASRA